MIKNNFLEKPGFIDNEYLDSYINLIEANKLKKYEKFKTQKHHIIPRSYFKLNNLPVDDSEDNLVNLSHKDHALAHYYLSFCTEGTLKYSNQNCIYRILGNSVYLKDKNYLEERQFLENLEKWDDMITDLLKTRSKMYTGKTGKPNTEEHKQQISIKNKGNIYVRRCVNGEWEVKKAKNLDEYYTYLNEGWEKGNRPRTECKAHKAKDLHSAISDNKKGKICVNNGTVNKYISKDELDIYLNQGWIKGGRKLYIKKRYIIKYADRELNVFEDDLPKFINIGWEIVREVPIKKEVE